LVKATDGWYTSQALEKIKVVLRHKFFQLLQGHVATEEECEALLNEPPSKATMKSRAPKLRMGKHNMAKGALPPEELAVCVGRERDFDVDRLTAQFSRL
jgi:general transcription factor 3C polypeptide 5 (transcription factor C subunit 1)